MRLRYFAWLREQVGKAEEEVELPSDIGTVAELVAWLKSRGPEYDRAFARADVIRAAVDLVHVKPGTAIAGAREVAFFPPVTGG